MNFDDYATTCVNTTHELTLLQYQDHKEDTPQVEVIPRSSDESRQVTLKYQVAIATAVIKSKPNTLTIEQYINRLKNKIDKMDFDHITTCSDDFKFDDDTEMIDDRITFNGEELNDSQATNVSVNLLEGLNMDTDLAEDEQVQTVTNSSKNTKDSIIKINNDDTQTTFCEDIQSQNLLDDNELIFQNLIQYDTNNLEKEPISSKDSHNEMIVLKNINNAQSLLDSQQTEIYSYNNNQINRDIYKEFNIPSSQNKSNINSSNIDNSQITFDSQETQLYNFQCTNVTKNHEFQNKIYNKNDSQTKFSIHDNNITQFKNEFKNINTDKQLFYSQTDLNNDQDLTENYTHISQSQTQFIEVQRNVLFKTKDCPNLKQKLNNETNDNQHKSAGIDEIIQNGVDKDFIIQTNNQLDTQYLDNTINDIEINKCNNNNKVSQSIIQFENDEEIHEIDTIDNIEIQNSQFEIPFKVIEELNRLKIYLEKKNKETDGTWSDSGYKSDSQSRNSFKSHPQTQDTLVNHSARSLLDFVLKGPLVLAAKEIVNEISWVLGRLIDQLYIEEKYFLFLEDILSAIDNLLKDIYEGESYDNDILQKDNNINRLFLLNRSSHIIKYTIEKITNILESYLSQITNDLLEINTKGTENLSYILHILECLLKRYLVIKNKNTQICNTQFSQEEKYLKKSSISDIWRKKWNPNYKTIKNDSIVDTKSIENKCMEVLNKIIVQAMEGYSLISFAALQCFNLLQS